MLIVKAKIKDYAKGFNVAGDFADALANIASNLLKDASARAEANQRKTVMAKDISNYFVSTKKAPEMLVVKAKIKEYVKDLNVAGDLADGLNFVLVDMVAKACERAEANGRKTVMAKDL